MQHRSFRADRSGLSGLWTILLGVWLVAGSFAYGAETQGNVVAKADELWRRGIEEVGKGDFLHAAETVQQIPGGGGLMDRIRTWLDEYQSKQAARKEMDRADFEKYIGYAQARIERKEYALALDKALLAGDVAEDREAFLALDWMQKLVNDSLAKADELRKKGEWKGAWHLYADLGALYEREPRYQKLEHEVLTHLRLDTMFNENSNWRERIENVNWKDAESALECIDLYYVEVPDFKSLTERGLEQLLLLADSQSAQKTFDGLKDEDDRRDFKARIGENLEQVRAAPTLDRRESVRRFRRAVQINKETIRLPEELLISELMRGALDPLDDFTTIIWPQDVEEFDKHTRGDFVGVGISIIKNKASEIEVVTPLEDTPAFRHGIQAGDVITKVDGAEIKSYSLNKVVDTITGLPNTPVTLTVRRGDSEIEFPLVRTKVKIQSVKGWQRRPDGTWNHWADEENKIAYIRITNFQKNTVEDLDNVMSELRPKGLKGLILDLRWNPGGLLDSAWQASSRFLNRGNGVVSTRGRNQGEDQRLNAAGDGPYVDFPLVVLVDEGSASASEIVSGSIRDNRRGTVIGQRTFGKFSVQNLIPLGSSNAKLKITTSRYYLPSGVSLHRDPTSQKWGVEPDIPIRLARWERFNAYQLRRDADLLGPPKPPAKAGDSDEKPVDLSEIDPLTGEETEPETKPEAELDAAKAGASQHGGASLGHATLHSDGKTADADAPKADELPPLEQPDENNRPKEDPQVDTALLFLRVKLLGILHPTLANAEANPTARRDGAPVPKQTAQP